MESDEFFFSRMLAFQLWVRREKFSIWLGTLHFEKQAHAPTTKSIYQNAGEHLRRQLGKSIFFSRVKKFQLERLPWNGKLERENLEWDKAQQQLCLTVKNDNRHKLHLRKFCWCFVREFSQKISIKVRRKRWKFVKCEESNR